MTFNKTYFSKKIFFILSIFILIWVILFFVPTTGNAAVTLIYFKVIPDNNKVYFEWKTADETGNDGFVIKKLKSGGDYLNDKDYLSLPSEDAEQKFDSWGEGGIYTGTYSTYDIDDGSEIISRFFDDNVVVGNTYWYILESIPSDNSLLSSYSDPVSVYIGTPTPTNTSTTLSSTSTQSNGATATKTPTSKPTKTKKPGTATPTFTATRYTNTGSGATSGTQAVKNNPTPDFEAETAAAQTAETGQPAVTEAVIPTATLVPLPSITIVFPTAKVKQPDVADASLASGAKTAKTNSETWLTPQRMIIVAVIALIWIMLGGWFYLSFKRLEK